MDRFLRASVITFLPPLMISCISVRNVAGTYGSRFVDLGFFSTRIVLQKDSSFTYRMRGDMAYDTAAGSYSVRGKYLSFHPNSWPVDTTGLGPFCRIWVTSDIPCRHMISKCKLGRNKLFFVQENGRKVARSADLSSRKKIVLWGSPYPKRRNYLKRLH